MAWYTCLVECFRRRRRYRHFVPVSMLDLEEDPDCLLVEPPQLTPHSCSTPRAFITAPGENRLFDDSYIRDSI